MIPFHAPELADRLWAAPLLRRYGDAASEAAFGTYYAWQNHFHYEIAEYDGYFLAHWDGGYLFPVGENAPDDLAAVLRALEEDASRRGEPLVLHFSEHFLPMAQRTCGGRFRVEEDRADADYLYRVADLAALSGKKYHGKRNHVAHFEKTYSYTFENVTTEAQERECVAMMEEWCSSNENPDDFAAELTAIRRIFAAREELQVRAGLLRVDGKVVAFAAGEESADGIFDQHFEKALVEYDGAYAVVNQQFMQHCIADYTLVNREEDMGLEGLRKAKLSYHPAQLVMKYTAAPVAQAAE